MKQALLRQFDLSVKVCNKLINRFRIFEDNSFECLTEWFDQNRYGHKVFWGKEPQTRLPRITVFVSPSMKENYARYGDLVAFDITYGLLRNVASDHMRYKVGVFTVSDTNLRALIAGIAILVD